MVEKIWNEHVIGGNPVKEYLMVEELADGKEIPYVESAFYNDASFFTKVLGLTDRDQMDMELVTEPLRKKSVEELIKEIESRSQQRFGLSLSSLSPVQKVPILKAINYSTNVSVKTLSRCFELAEEEVSAILKRK